ncbi:MAG: hypothetical protein R3F53_28670 [Gammaproteobacteria bacterium]
MGTIARNQAIDNLRRSANQTLPGDPVDELHWLVLMMARNPMK